MRCSFIYYVFNLPISALLIATTASACEERISTPFLLDLDLNELPKEPRSSLSPHTTLQFDLNMSPDGEDLLPKSHSSCDKQGASSAAINCADPYQHLEEEQLATILCSLRSNSCESIIDSHSNVDHNYGQEPLAQEPNLLIIPRKRRTKTSHDSPKAKRFKQAVIPGHHESTWRTEKYIDPLRKEVHDLKWSFSEPTGIQQESAKLVTYGKGKEKKTESSDNRNSLEISNQANRASSEASAEQSSPRGSISESISKVNSNSGQEPLAQDLLAINIPRKPRMNTSKKSPTANKVIEGDIHPFPNKFFQKTSNKHLEQELYRKKIQDEYRGHSS
ncbi:hypothetical protein PCANC_14030 [Puccinia coronata f. sp. avenae]|uniref:Uncharacterized protein n=1 Tax=Puccinia coronata f. sp. avenae TaxID=200324 RepID=A0A2N5VRJ1_9BASI|nr:hypothetical protein PCASD_20276 [Puccinia coronata f. sp. avenae]PLW32455.1 hypothetical protein PCASD_17950 [Puccinia coronata f. sp. avenae]PLW52609.1 hypothetical protein PCANC_14030 [Puccinia coronata f. sp. avenae]